jgi:branched-chain amino acid transport system permease protein
MSGRRAGRRPPGRAALVAGLGALALTLPALVGFDPYVLYVGGGAWLWAALATAWAVPAFAGQVSFGQAAYFGVGGYTSALLAQRAGASPWLGVLAAAAAGGAAGVPMGLAGGRVRGAYLALVTFAYAETLRASALNWTGLTGGGSGLVGVPDLPPLPLLGVAGGRASGYYLALALLGASVALAAALRRGRVGLAWAAIREREDRAAQLGVSPVPYKVLAFVCSGAVTGAGGALFVHGVRVVEPDLAFGRGVSVLPLVMALFGGARPLLGPALGAVGLHLVSELVFQPLWPRLHQLPYALALIAVLLALPRGLAGSLRRA